MKSIRLLFMVFAAVIVNMAGCKKTEEKPDTSAVLETAIASNLFNDLFKQADNTAKLFLNEPVPQKRNTSSLAEGCGTITIEPVDTTFPKTITIDFGEVNCTGIDLRTRRGIIIAVISDWYRNEGCTLTVTTSNYYLDNYKIEGTKTIINNGLNDSENMTFSVTVENGVITNSQEETFTWNSTRTNEWIAGEGTQMNILDDVYEITGTASGTTSRQKDYTLTITTPLNVAIGCPWIRSGIIQVDTDPARIILDYGDGSCDANATATILGQTIPIIIR